MLSETRYELTVKSLTDSQQNDLHQLCSFINTQHESTRVIEREGKERKGKKKEKEGRETERERKIHAAKPHIITAHMELVLQKFLNINLYTKKGCCSSLINENKCCCRKGMELFWTFCYREIIHPNHCANGHIVIEQSFIPQCIFCPDQFSYFTSLRPKIYII